MIRQFQRCGTINGVLRYLVDHHIQLPDRVRSGPRTGELDWRRPNRVTLSNLLHNPIYAGAYVYGRRPTDPRRRQPARPSTARTVAPPQQWEVLIKDHRLAYIDWDQYERNLRQLAANTGQAGGVVRAGPSLLSGRLTFGRCGLAMATQYTNSGSGLRYSCSREAVDYGAPLCQSLSGAPLDALIGRLVLEALQPAALEISLQVAEDLQTEWISTGKACVPVELGLRVAISEDQHGFILHHRVMKRITDEQVAVSLEEEAVERFPTVASTNMDKSFHGPRQPTRVERGDLLSGAAEEGQVLGGGARTRRRSAALDPTAPETLRRGVRHWRSTGSTVVANTESTASSAMSPRQWWRAAFGVGGRGGAEQAGRTAPTTYRLTLSIGSGASPDGSGAPAVWR